MSRELDLLPFSGENVGRRLLSWSQTLKLGLCVGLSSCHDTLSLHMRKEKIGLGSKGKVHPCTGTEALYRPYGP